MKHIIERSYLVRRVERYEIDLGDDSDPNEFIEHHFNSFDTEVVTVGVLQGVRDEPVTDYEELKLAVVDRQAGKLLPFRKRERP